MAKKRPDTVEGRPMSCMGCDKSVEEKEVIRNVDGTWHEDCLEDHLIDAMAQQQKAEARARRESK